MSLVLISMMVMIIVISVIIPMIIIEVIKIAETSYKGWNSKICTPLYTTLT